LRGLSDSDLLATASVGARPHRERQRRAKCKTAAHVPFTFIRGGLLGLGYLSAASCLGRDPSGWPVSWSSQAPGSVVVELWGGNLPAGTNASGADARIAARRRTFRCRPALRSSRGQRMLLVKTCDASHGPHVTGLTHMRN